MYCIVRDKSISNMTTTTTTFDPSLNRSKDVSTFNDQGSVELFYFCRAVIFLGLMIQFFVVTIDFTTSSSSASNLNKS